MRTRFVGLVLLAGLLAALPATAQDTPVTAAGKGLQLSLGGMVQSRLSYGWTTDGRADETARVGFGMRRIRLRTTAEIGDYAGAFLQIAGASGGVRVIDAWAAYERGALRVRVGRMVSAQPRAITLTSSSHLDAIDRAAIAERWARLTVGSDGRDFGIDLRYGGAQGEAILFFHNGDGDFGAARSNFREGISGDGDVTRGSERSLSEMAVSFYSALRPAALPGVEVGGFVGYNGSENPNTMADERGRAYVSYAAHLYWGARPGSQRLRLKADVIGIQFEEIPGASPAVENQSVLGLSLLGAVGLSRGAEVFARVEQYDPNTNRSGRGDLFVTGGGSLSLSALRGGPYQRARLTLAYSTRRPEDTDDEPVQHLVIFQAQLAF